MKAGRWVRQVSQMRLQVCGCDAMFDFLSGEQQLTRPNNRSEQAGRQAGKQAEKLASKQQWEWGLKNRTAAAAAAATRNGSRVRG